jgi:putative transcriptional regulator
MDAVEEGFAGEQLIECRLTELLQAKGMTLSRLSELVDVSIVNLSILKNNKAKAIRFSTLQSICVALESQVGELLVLSKDSSQG